MHVDSVPGESTAKVNKMDFGGGGFSSTASGDELAGELLSKMAGGPRRAHKCRFIRRKQRAATKS